MGRLVSEIDASNASITFAYDAVGLQISTTDRLERRHDTSFDAVGQLTSESWIVSGSPTATNSYGCDAIGLRTNAGNAMGMYTFTFDAAGRVTSVQQPFGATQTFAYDSAGRRTRVEEDSFGGVTTSVYDAPRQPTDVIQTFWHAFGLPSVPRISFSSGAVFGSSAMSSKVDTFACPCMFDCPARLNTLRGAFAASAYGAFAPGFLSRRMSSGVSVAASMARIVSRTDFAFNFINSLGKFGSSFSK